MRPTRGYSCWNKGYPYRESKKLATRYREDKRPHARMNALRGIPAPKNTTKHDFIILDNRLDKIRPKPNWTKSDAHFLINAYTTIAWHSARHISDMSKLTGYFIDLFDKQHGLCAITGIPLHGAPLLKYNGIGVDLIRKKIGPVKGNIRLVSCPLAIMRYRYPEYATQNITLPKSHNYPTQDISYAIAHTMYWYIQKEKPFKNLPITIEFPPEDSRRQPPLMAFSWSYAVPINATYERIVIKTDRFCAVFLDKDVLVLDPDHGINRGHNEKKISLADPNFNFEEEICKSASNAFMRKSCSLLRDFDGGY